MVWPRLDYRLIAARCEPRPVRDREVCRCEPLFSACQNNGHVVQNLLTHVMLRLLQAWSLPRDPAIGAWKLAPACRHVRQLKAHLAAASTCLLPGTHCSQQAVQHDLIASGLVLLGEGAGACVKALANSVMFSNPVLHPAGAGGAARGARSGAGGSYVSKGAPVKKAFPVSKGIPVQGSLAGARAFRPPRGRSSAELSHSATWRGWC